MNPSNDGTLIRLPIPELTEDQRAKVLQAVQQLRSAVTASIGVDQEMIDTDHAVIGHPFEDIRCFIFHAADDDIAALSF